MKKLFTLLLCISVILMPIKAEAKSQKFNYYCDAKQSLDDKTFYMTCHINLETDFDINHVTGNLILKNVSLQDIRTKSDWTNSNGLNTTVDFKSSTSHKGTIEVADLVFTGNLADTECEASFEPLVVENNVQTCVIIDNEYYGKNGTKVTAEKYYEECYKYTCTVVDNTYYYNHEGKSVSYDEFLKDCSEVETPATGINYGYIVLPLGIVSIIAITKIAKKNRKIYKK